MRVPHSPHSLRKVMPVASVKPSPSSDNEEFSMDSSTSINDMIKLNNMENNDYDKDQSVFSSKSPTSRPPRPTYTSKGRDGKYMVGVEASKMEKHREFFEKHIMDVTNNSQEHVKEGSTTMNNCLDKETLKSDQNTNMTAESIGNKGGFSTNNRGRERTRVSAVQRLVERKLAQKEKEKIRQREQDEKMRCTTVKNDLSSAHRRSASSNGYINIGASSRNRSRDRSWTRELDPRFLCSPSDLSSNNSNLPHDDAAATSSNNRNKTCRTVTENKYLANLLLRTSRSCDRLYGDSNEATKTFITISAGKPTRIREQSPCKRDKGTDQRWRGRSIDRTSTGSSINSENSSSDEEVSSPPIKVAKSFAPTFSPKLEPHSKRDVVLEKAAPLKSTGLLREFSFIKENSPVHEKETKVRKTSYTTEKTIQVNTASTKNRKLSVDINLLTKNFSTSPEDKFAFNHKRCNNSPTSDLPSTSSEFSTNSSSFQSSSSSSSLNGSDISSNSSLDGSNHESSPTPNPIRSSSKSSDGKSENDSHLSKRRISLEQRFKARLIQPTVFPSKDNSRQVNETNQNTSPQPRLRERKKSKLSAAAALKISQLNDSRIASNSPSSDSNSSNSSFQNISESEAYLYDVENIISKEGHKYQKVSVTTKSEAKAASSSVTNAVPRRRVSQGNLAGHSTHQNRLPKGPSPRRRKHSAPVHLNKNCDTFKEETEEEIFNNQEKFGFISGLTGSRSNLFTNSQADQKKEEGNQLYKTKSYREALQRYSEAIQLAPECPAFYGNRSACHMMLSQFTQALADAKCSVQLDANFVKGYVRVSKCCVALGDAISAQQAIDKALQIEPNNTAVLQEKASVKQLSTYIADYNQAYQAKDYRKALFCLDRALSISSASRHIKISRAECLAFLGRYAEAQEIANDILRLDNINAEAIYVRGLCLYNEDNVDKAFTHFQQVLKLAPDHTKAREIYKKAKQLKQKKEEGNLAFKSGKLQDAYTLYSEALQIDPFNKYTNAKLYFNRATVAAKLKKLKESIQDCTSALELDEKYIKAVLRRAKSYMDLEMYEEAVRDYELANKMDRGNSDVRQLLQQAKLELKKSKRKDYYKILGVSKDANDDEVKKAYRKRALVHHPDRHSSASEDERQEHEKKFKEIGEAYGVLSDAKKRNRYDQGHDIDDLEGHGHGFSQDIDPNQIFQAFFSQGGGGGGGQQHFSFGGQGGMPGGFSFQFG